MTGSSGAAPHRDQAGYQPLAWALAVILLATVWAFPYFPSQDGPSHLYNTSILLGWNEPGSIFPDYYRRDLTPVPNWLGTVLLYLLMLLAPPLTAAKLLISICVASMTATWCGWMAALGRGRSPLVLLGPLFSFGYPLYKGFYGYCLSLPLFLLAAALAWRWRTRKDLMAVGVLNLLLAAVFLTHVISFCMALIVSAILLASGAGRPSLRSAAGALARLLPAGLLLPAYLAGSSSGPSARWSAGMLARYLLRGEWMVSFSQAQLLVSAAVMALLAGLGVHAALGRRRAPGTNPEVGALLAAGSVAVILYAAMPQGMAGGWNLSERLAIYPVLLLAPLAAGPLVRPARTATALAIVLLTGAQAGLAYRFHARTKERLSEYLSLIDRMEPRRVLLPLRWRDDDPDLRFRPLLHAPSYYAMETGSIDLGNYEAKTEYFQIRFRPDTVRLEGSPGNMLPPAGGGEPPLVTVPSHHSIEAEPGSIDVRRYADGIDYLIIWNMPPGAREELLPRYKEAYEIVAQRGRGLLLRRRETNGSQRRADRERLQAP